MSEFKNWNDPIIAEFRANGGKVGGQFAGGKMLLLHTTGAKTGQERVNPLAYQELGDGKYAVFGSKAGMPSHPDWYYNLKANPQVKIEIGTETVEAVARVAKGEERERIWEQQKKDAPGFAEYEKKVTRKIPVVILERVR
jgi:deazaflavin-dependent oxidoreductase (nitroreductase family)